MSQRSLLRKSSGVTRDTWLYCCPRGHLALNKWQISRITDRHDVVRSNALSSACVLAIVDRTDRNGGRQTVNAGNVRSPDPFCRSREKSTRCLISLTKSDDREAGVRFVKHKYDYRTELDDTMSCYQLIERWTILKRRYECWKTQQFTQQSAPQQRARNGAYCPTTSMTCATVQLMLKSGCW